MIETTKMYNIIYNNKNYIYNNFNDLSEKLENEYGGIFIIQFNDIWINRWDLTSHGLASDIHHIKNCDLNTFPCFVEIDINAFLSFHDKWNIFPYKHLINKDLIYIPNNCNIFDFNEFIIFGKCYDLINLDLFWKVNDSMTRLELLRHLPDAGLNEFISVDICLDSIDLNLLFDKRSNDFIKKICENITITPSIAYFLKNKSILLDNIYDVLDIDLFNIRDFYKGNLSILSKLNIEAYDAIKIILNDTITKDSDKINLLTKLEYDCRFFLLIYGYNIYIDNLLNLLYLYNMTDVLYIIPDENTFNKYLNINNIQLTDVQIVEYYTFFPRYFLHDKIREMYNNSDIMIPKATILPLLYKHQIPFYKSKVEDTMNLSTYIISTLYKDSYKEFLYDRNVKSMIMLT